MRVPVTCGMRRIVVFGVGSAAPELSRLAKGHAERAPAVEGLQGENEMHEKRPVEQERACRVAPQGVEPSAARLHGLDGDEAQGMVAEMGQEKRPENQPGNEAHLAQADGALEGSRG